LEDSGIHGRIILIWILRKYDRRAWAGFTWLRIGTSGSSSGHSNEPSGSKKCWEFLDLLNSYYLLKTDSTPRRG
jgi:hypothetical protein